MSAINDGKQQDASLVAATRIHLGKQSSPPLQSRLNSMVSSFLTLASSSRNIIRTAIAVDPAPKIDGYDLVQAVREAVEQYAKNMNKKRAKEDGGIDNGDGSSDTNNVLPVECDVIPVTPWGNFVPALNALISWALTITNEAERILFISAETTLTSQCVEELCRHVDLHDTLVAGVALPGHHYHGGGLVVELNGRTSPWNTCAIWNLSKLALTGFPLVADGLHRFDDGSPGVSGIEECSTILLSQQLRPSTQQLDFDKGKLNKNLEDKESTKNLAFNKAKLVKIAGVEWNQTFEDEERKTWHESKMESKMTRAERHRDLMGSYLKGWVVHC